MSINYLELNVSDLRKECKDRGLDSAGLKVHLIERLNKYDKDQELLIEAEKKAKELAEERAKELEEQKILKIEKEKEDEARRIKQKEEERKRLRKTKSIYELASAEPDEWFEDTTVHIDYYNSDLNLLIEEDECYVKPFHKDGFQFMYAGAKSNYGVADGNRVFYEVKLINLYKVDWDNDAGQMNEIRVGWSKSNADLMLGDDVLSYAYDITGKKKTESSWDDYSTVGLKEGDIIGCCLEFSEEVFKISFCVNGEYHGVAYEIKKNELEGGVLVPHILTRNISYEVNFGNGDKNPWFLPKTNRSNDNDILIEDDSWSLLGKLDLDKRERGSSPPKKYSDSEVLMMIGLPCSGKTYWVDNYIMENPSKNFNLLGINKMLSLMKCENIRKHENSKFRDKILQSATDTLNKLMDIAPYRRRNYILDQTNVYPNGQRRRMKTFQRFNRKAIIVVPTNDVYQNRLKQAIEDQNKDIPDQALLQMKENFSIPNENSELFDDITFVELNRDDAESLIKSYNDEAKLQLKKQTSSKDNHKYNSPNKSVNNTVDDDDESCALWNKSISKRSNDSDDDKHEKKGRSSLEPPNKRSRWEEDNKSSDKFRKDNFRGRGGRGRGGNTRYGETDSSQKYTSNRGGSSGRGGRFNQRSMPTYESTSSHRNFDKNMGNPHSINSSKFSDRTTNKNNDRFGRSRSPRRSRSIDRRKDFNRDIKSDRSHRGSTTKFGDAPNSRFNDAPKSRFEDAPKRFNDIPKSRFDDAPKSRLDNIPRGRFNEIPPVKLPERSSRFADSRSRENSKMTEFRPQSMMSQLAQSRNEDFMNSQLPSRQIAVANDYSHQAPPIQQLSQIKTEFAPSKFEMFRNKQASRLPQSAPIRPEMMNTQYSSSSLNPIGLSHGSQSSYQQQNFMPHQQSFSNPSQSYQPQIQNNSNGCQPSNSMILQNQGSRPQFNINQHMQKPQQRMANPQIQTASNPYLQTPIQPQPYSSVPTFIQTKPAVKPNNGGFKSNNTLSQQTQNSTVNVGQDNSNIVTYNNLNQYSRGASSANYQSRGKPTPTPTQAPNNQTSNNERGGHNHRWAARGRAGIPVNKSGSGHTASVSTYNQPMEYNYSSAGITSSAALQSSGRTNLHPRFDDLSVLNNNTMSQIPKSRGGSRFADSNTKPTTTPDPANSRMDAAAYYNYAAQSYDNSSAVTVDPLASSTNIYNNQYYNTSGATSGYSRGGNY